MSSPAATHPPTEAASAADFESIIRYAQCWEDADVLLDALDVREGDTCLSIASAGDNSLSLLTRSPAKVIAVDLNPAQLACVSLRVAAYQRLDHPGLLALLGSTPAAPAEREELYRGCREALEAPIRDFWDARPDAIAAGIGSAGKFERYFRLFRRWVLPLVHRRRTVDRLLEPRGPLARQRFYDDTWDTRAWRAMFAAFFSRTVMGRLGRDPALFKYVQGDVAERILARGKHALAVLDPSTNPYLRWILQERHVSAALPHALRPEHFGAIRAHLPRLELRQASVEQALAGLPRRSVHRYNLSDIFEYMSEPNFHAQLGSLADAAAPGGRLVYWNMLVPRSRPETLAGRLRPMTDLAEQLYAQDQAFFYSRLVIEEAV